MTDVHTEVKCPTCGKFQQIDSGFSTGAGEVRFRLACGHGHFADEGKLAMVSGRKLPSPERLGIPRLLTFSIPLIVFSAVLYFTIGADLPFVVSIFLAVVGGWQFYRRNRGRSSFKPNTL